MQLELVQCWRDKRARYRPAGEVIDTRAYDVAPLEGDAQAKAFVVTHHYSGTYPAARFRYGLFRRGELQGVAVFSHPCNDAVLTSVFPGAALDSVELGRFVLLDEVPSIIPRAGLLRLAVPAPTSRGSKPRNNRGLGCFLLLPALGSPPRSTSVRGPG